VLTKTQLRTAKTQELERLQARIQTELETRVQQELQRLKREQSAAGAFESEASEKLTRVTGKWLSGMG